jgi:hypothetical protein
MISIDQTATLLYQTATLLFTEPDDDIDTYCGKDASTPRDDFYESSLAW